MDGNMVCIVDDNFVNLQESDALFINPKDVKDKHLHETIINLMGNDGDSIVKYHSEGGGDYLEEPRSDKDEN